MTHQPNPSFPPSATEPPQHRRVRLAVWLAVGVGGLVGAVSALVLTAVVTAEPQRPVHVVEGRRAPTTRPEHAVDVVPRPTYLVTQDEIDEATTDRRVAIDPAVTEPTRPDAGPTTAAGTPPPDRPAYLIIQDEIDRALRERDRVADTDG